jgi:hypothetical protein
MRRAFPIAAALVIGLVAGVLLGGSHSHPAPPHPDSPGPTRLGAGGVGAGYAHSRAGALAANARYQQAFADAAILRPRALRERVEAVATPRFAPQLLEALTPGQKRLAAGPLGEGLAEGVPTLYFGAPLFYRVLSYSPREAVIASWGLSVLGNLSTAEPGAYFGTSQVTLVWTEGDWKIADSRVRFGPTPRIVAARKRGEGFALVELLKGMRSYAATP